ncbi:MAG TPA: LytTR family DNA-binding domain-containing protein [Burkholderiaceae bacterium]
MMERRPALRALIVDDEPLARNNLLTLLARDGELQVVGQCGSGEEALAAIPALKPDIVFLDVQMPECDGFDVLERLAGAPGFSVVFVTAYHEHAVRAFEVGALDYLLKPFDDKRFAQVLERVRARHSQPAEARRFIVKNGGTIDVVKLKDIVWVEAADYYSTLHTAGKSHMLRRSLADLETQLAPQGFARIHRSAIVNLERVRSLEIRADGEYEVLLQDGERLRMSRGYRKSVLESLAK